MTVSKLWSRWSNHIILFICCLSIVFLLGKDLNPFSNEMFAGHDETQAGRIQQFVLNLQNGQIPPRIAPDMSFGMGFPIFNFYAPTAYWLTSLFVLIGAPIIVALKLSYVIAIITAFIGMALLLRIYFDKPASYLGAAAYVTTPYLALDIFVRANLAEVWFFALFPIGLYLLQTVTKSRLLVTVIILSLLFTSHNILSLVSVAIMIVMALIMKHKKLPFVTICLSLLASAFFLLPAIAELGFVQAQARAITTSYADHFLCINQLWSSLWGFAGSAAGCTADGMSFQIGKVQILLGVAGLGLFIYQAIKDKKLTHRTMIGFTAILGLGSLFMVLPISQFFWQIFEPILSLFQFPWRFLIFIVFSLAFFSAYCINTIKVPFKLLGTIGIIVFLFVFNQKFFYAQNISSTEFEKTFLSSTYIQNSLAFKAAEYIPYTVDYGSWRKLEGTTTIISDPIVRTGKEELLVLKSGGFDRLFSIKSTELTKLNIHYAPYWKITLNNEEVVPTEFDTLGRPMIKLSGTEFDTIRVQYRQTSLEQVSNLISFITLVSLLFFSVKTIPWTKLNIKKI